MLTSTQLAAPIRWQLSHEEGVDMCPDGFPRAVVPLWHVPQLPGVTPVWLNVAGTQAVVR